VVLNRAKHQLGWSETTKSFFVAWNHQAIWWHVRGHDLETQVLLCVFVPWHCCTPCVSLQAFLVFGTRPASCGPPARSHESLGMRLRFLGLWLEGWCYIICLCYILYKTYWNVILYNVFDKLYTIHLRASIPSFFWGASHDTTEITLTGGDFPMHFYSLQRNDGQLHGALQSLLAKCDSKPAAGQRGRFRLWQKHGED